MLFFRWVNKSINTYSISGELDNSSGIYSAQVEGGKVGELGGVVGRWLGCWWTLTGLGLTAYGKQSLRITMKTPEDEDGDATTLNGAAIQGTVTRKDTSTDTDTVKDIYVCTKV